MAKNKILISFCLTFIAFFDSSAQKFEKNDDRFWNERTIRYYDINAQIIIQKIISLDSNSVKLTVPKYEIGLVIYRTSIDPIAFMQKGGQIVFEDGTVVNFSDPVTINYLHSGRHEFCIKHELTEIELNLFLQKRIDSFNIYDLKQRLDKWQKETYIEMFNKLLTEK